ncbi:hypothetical protein [Mycobacterium sp. 23]|uniref:hypothetical protein n=1 Tax=Mycobacterium sp. 23 TaxID=3400424 RepID=UPI003AABE0AD
MPQRPPSVATESLKADFARLRQRVSGTVGVVLNAVGTHQIPVILGSAPAGPAWSTIKVPLAIAALRHAGTATVTPNITAAITESDNDAAEALWASLGDPAVAARKVEDVLREAGDRTVVESERVRPPFTAFGQTMWDVSEQVKFLSSAVCDQRNKPVFDLMGQIIDGQSWGLGRIADTRFKGGWGPSPAGNYLVRQIGVIASAGGMTAVAVALEPSSGAFADGVGDIDEVTRWLAEHISALPKGVCGS